MGTFWFIVIAVLWTGFMVLEGFGVGMLHGVVGRTEVGRRVAIATIGPLKPGRADTDRDLAGARELMTDARRPGGGELPPLPRDLLALAEAELHLAESRPVHALTVLGEVAYGQDAPLGETARILTARAYLASASPARAASLLAPVPEWREVGPAVRVEAWLVAALAPMPWATTARSRSRSARRPWRPHPMGSSHRGTAPGPACAS